MKDEKDKLIDDEGGIRLLSQLRFDALYQTSIQSRMAHDERIEKMASALMAKDEEVLNYLPCAYYIIAFGDVMGESWFVKCGISTHYLKRYGDYERWAKKEGIYCWDAGSFMFDDKKSAREYEQLILDEREGDVITIGGEILEGNMAKRQERIMSRFPHHTEMFDYDYEPSLLERPENSHTWEEFWECEGCVADYYDIDHPMWKRFIRIEWVSE